MTEAKPEIAEDNLEDTVHFQVMLRETIRNDDFWSETALRNCCDIVSNGYNIVQTLQHCVLC